MSVPIRRFALALLANLAFAVTALAASYSIDFTDLWWNSPAESESGWGMNVIQQNDILFLTFFVYGPDSTPRWYVASSVTPTSPQPGGAVRFSGTLYRTTGPWFGAANFNPAAVTVTAVGIATVTFDTPTTGTLSYTIDGTPVVKNIARQTYRANSVAGAYTGGMYATSSSCTPASYNGFIRLDGVLTVTQPAPQARFTVQFPIDATNVGTCTFVGNYAQQGRLANVTQGTFSCAPVNLVPNAGTFTMTAVDSQLNGFHASFTGRDQFCNYDGRFGGIRSPGG